MFLKKEYCHFFTNKNGRDDTVDKFTFIRNTDQRSSTLYFSLLDFLCFLPAFFSVDLHILHLLTALRVFRILLNAVIKSNYAPDDKTKNIGVVDLQNHQLGKTHLRVSLRFQILKEILIIGTAELLAQSDQPYKDHRKDHYPLRSFFGIFWL